MIEFIRSCYLGTYPHFAIPALIMIVWLLVEKKRLSKEEIILLVLYSIFYLGIIVQILIADRMLYVSRRYLVPFAPLLFGFTAMFVLKVYDRLKRPKLFMALSAGLIAFIVWEAVEPTAKEYYKHKYVVENDCIRAMCEFIENDFKEERIRKDVKVWWHEPRFPVRPILKDAPEKLIYMVGGTYWNDFFPDDPVDYLIVPLKRKYDPEGYVLVFETEQFLVYKPVSAFADAAAAPETPDDAQAETGTPLSGSGAAEENVP